MAVMNYDLSNYCLQYYGGRLVWAKLDSNGEHHSDDDIPAIISLDAKYVEWWFHGIKCESKEERDRYMKLKAFW